MKRLLCILPKWLGGGHKRGRHLRVEGEFRILACPRCGRTTRYPRKKADAEPAA